MFHSPTEDSSISWKSPGFIEARYSSIMACMSCPGSCTPDSLVGPGAIVAVTTPVVTIAVTAATSSPLNVELRSIMRSFLGWREWRGSGAAENFGELSYELGIDP